jgi:hypothetical protein
VTITVTKPLTVHLEPQLLQAIPAPGVVTLTATTRASDAGPVSQVEFGESRLFSRRSVGIATAPPYQVTVSDLAPGTYIFTAIATDSTGAAAAANIQIRVAYPPDIFSIAKNGGSFALGVSGIVGITYQLQSTTDFIKWDDRVANDTSVNGLMTLEDNSGDQMRFYRVVAR